MSKSQGARGRDWSSSPCFVAMMSGRSAMHSCVMASLVWVASSFQLVAPRPMLSTPTAAPRAGRLNLALDLTSEASVLLAGLGDSLGLQGYGGVSTFSQTDTGANGDLNLIVAVGVLFPTLVTVAFFKDNIADAFAPDIYSEDNLPPGWRKVPSQSRPGQFSFENSATRERYDKLPQAARRGNM